MKRDRITIFAAFAGSFMLATLPITAEGQEGTPLPPANPPALEQPDPVIPDPTQSPASAPIGATDKMACKHVVVIEDIPYTWDKLEKGTDTAWAAYMNGEFTRSVPVFAKIADLGHPIAQWLMGNVYFFGQGVPLDYRTSLSYFERAALQGCFAAYAPTAQMYEKGQGTLPDPGKAYMWYNIAVAQLPQGKDRRLMVERREAVAGLLTPAQIEAAQKRSLQFVPKLVTPPDISELPDDFFKQP